MRVLEEKLLFMLEAVKLKEVVIYLILITHLLGTNEKFFRLGRSEFTYNAMR